MQSDHWREVDEAPGGTYAGTLRAVLEAARDQSLQCRCFTFGDEAALLALWMGSAKSLSRVGIEVTDGKPLPSRPTFGLLLATRTPDHEAVTELDESEPICKLHATRIAFLPSGCDDPETQLEPVGSRVGTLRFEPGPEPFEFPVFELRAATAPAMKPVAMTRRVKRPSDNLARRGDWFLRGSGGA